MPEVTEAMIERALDRLWKGEPGVLRQIVHIDSYPGEYEGDPEAYTKLPTTFNDMKQAAREMLEAALDEDLGVCPNCESTKVHRHPNPPVPALCLVCGDCRANWAGVRQPVLD